MSSWQRGRLRRALPWRRCWRAAFPSRTQAERAPPERETQPEIEHSAGAAARAADDARRAASHARGAVANARRRRAAPTSQLASRRRGRRRRRWPHLAAKKLRPARTTPPLPRSARRSPPASRGAARTRAAPPCAECEVSAGQLHAAHPGIPARRSTFQRAASGCCRCTPTCICWRRPTTTFTARARRRAASSRALLAPSAAAPPARPRSSGHRRCSRRAAAGAPGPYAHLPRDAATTRESLAACYSNETFPGLVEALAAPLPAGGVGAAGGAAALHANSSEVALRAFTEEDFSTRTPTARQIAELIVAALWRAAGCTDDTASSRYCPTTTSPRRAPPRRHHLRRGCRRPPSAADACRAADVLAHRERRYRRRGERDVAFGDELRAHVLECAAGRTSSRWWVRRSPATLRRRPARR